MLGKSGRQPLVRLILPCYWDNILLRTLLDAPCIIRFFHSGMWEQQLFLALFEPRRFFRLFVSGGSTVISSPSCIQCCLKTQGGTCTDLWSALLQFFPLLFSALYTPNCQPLLFDSGRLHLACISLPLLLCWNSLRVVVEGNHRGYLICFSFLRDHCPILITCLVS